MAARARHGSHLAATVDSLYVCRLLQVAFFAAAREAGPQQLTAKTAHSPGKCTPRVARLTTRPRIARVCRTVGQPEASFEIAPGSHTPALVDALQTAYPQLERLLPRCALAVNGQYVEGPQPLADGCEVAVLPPMSGG
jgi:molybdopterin converting factor small subunit